MIILQSTSEKIQLVLGRNITTNQLEYNVSYVDVTITTYTPGAGLGTSNNVTAVDIVAAPAVSTKRHVKLITVHNKDTVSQVVIIQKVTASGTRVLCKVILSSLDNLEYTDGSGFTILDDNGTEEAAGTTLGISAGTNSISGANTVSFQNANGISFGLNASSVLTASASGVSVSFFDIPCMQLNSYTLTHGANNYALYFQRMWMPFYMTATRADMLAALSVAASGAGTISMSFAMYTRSRAALYSASSTTSGLNFAAGGATSDSNSYLGVSGTRWRTFNLGNWAFTPGEYFIAWAYTFAPNNSFTVFGQSTVAPLAVPGAITSNSIGNEFNFYGIHGAYVQAIGAMPGAVGPEDIAWCHSASGSVVFRQPYFRFFGSH